MLLGFLIGIVAGLRAMTAPAVVSWAAYLGWIDLRATWLAWLGSGFAPWVLLVLAVGEMVADQLPSTPSRKAPAAFGTRIVSGAISGAAVGAGGMGALVAGIVGAVAGTLGGYEVRMRMAASFGNDRPAAFIEDAVAVGVALLIVAAA